MGRFRITTPKNELQAFMDWIHKNYGEMDEVVQDAEYDEDEERKYWIARMGKQAAVDVYATGRIGIGSFGFDSNEEKRINMLH